MKIVQLTTGTLLAIMMLATSCDVIDNPIQEGGPIDPPDTATFTKNVLLEDYTGHTCGQCPCSSRHSRKHG